MMAIQESVLAASLPDADRALPFLSSSSLISCHLPSPPCRHLAEHKRRPPTFPVLSFFPFSLSAHRHHPSSPALPLFSASSPHPTALFASASSTVAAFSPSPPPSAPSWSIPLPHPLSLSFAALPSPPRRPFVGDLGVRKNLHGFEAHRRRPPTSVPSLFSPLASAPSSLIDAAAVASFTAASPPPTKPSCRRRLPYSSSTDVVAASLFLHRCPASPPVTQEVLALLVSASVRCHRRGLEPEMCIG